MSDPKRVNLSEKALKSVFVGNAENSKAYTLLDLDLNVIVESRDVGFVEKSLYVTQRNKKTAKRSQED